MLAREHKQIALISSFLTLTVGIIIGGMWFQIQQQQLNRILIEAIKEKDEQNVLLLLKRGADPDSLDPSQEKSTLENLLTNWLHTKFRGLHNGTPALLLAITKAPSPYEDKAGYAKSVAIVKSLLDQGARVDTKDEKGEDVLNLAVETAYDLQLVRLLIEHRVNTSLNNSGRQSSFLDRKNPLNGRTPLMTAAGWGEVDLLNLLLDAGANINAQANSGDTALMFAVDKGRPENIACLLTHHANINLKNRRGDTALSLAKESLAIKKVTPFTHEAGADFWQHIVRSLERAGS